MYMYIVHNQHQAYSKSSEIKSLAGKSQSPIFELLITFRMIHAVIFKTGKLCERSGKPHKKVNLYTYLPIFECIYSYFTYRSTFTQYYFLFFKNFPWNINKSQSIAHGIIL